MKICTEMSELRNFKVTTFWRGLDTTGQAALLVVKAVVFASLHVTHTYLCQPGRHSSWDGFLAVIFAATVFSF